MADDRFVVSAFTLASWRNGKLEVTAANSGASVVTGDLEAVRVLNAFARPTTIPEALAALGPITPAAVTALIQDWLRNGLLVPAAPPEAAERHGWDASALAYHRRSRRTAPRKALVTLALPPSSGPQATALQLARDGFGSERSFVDVLEARRSVRTWTAAPISFEKLSGLLWLSARDRSAGKGGSGASRPYPSGGALYSLELYLVFGERAVEGIGQGVFRYLPGPHQLESITAEAADVRAFLLAAGRSAGAEPPPSVVLLTSRFARPSESYGDLAYSLVLKEVGCLFQTLYLVAESLGLGVCALGGGAPPGLLTRLLHTSEIAEPGVGELALGSL